MTTTSVPDPSPAPAQVSSGEQARTPRRPLHCPPATHHTRTGTHDYTVTSLADGGRRVTGTYTGGPVPIEIWVEFDPGSRFQYVAVQQYRHIGATEWQQINGRTQDTDHRAVQQAHSHALTTDAEAGKDPTWVARATVQRAEQRLHMAAEAMHRIRLNLASSGPYTANVAKRIHDEQARLIPALQLWRSLARAGRYTDGPVLTLVVDLLQNHPGADVDDILTTLGADPATNAPLTGPTSTDQR